MFQKYPEGIAKVALNNTHPKYYTTVLKHSTECSYKGPRGAAVGCFEKKEYWDTLFCSIELSDSELDDFQNFHWVKSYFGEERELAKGKQVQCSLDHWVIEKKGMLRGSGVLYQVEEKKKKNLFR